MKRPSITSEIVAQAVQKLATGNGWDAEQVAEVAKTFRSHMDGYQLAKELESRCYWDISVADVEALDEVWISVREAHGDACMTWVKEYDIQPPLPIGAMTTKGEITGISRHSAACYEVRENGDKDESRRLIIRFEDARAVTADNEMVA